LERLRLLDGIDPLQARREREAEQRRTEASKITFREAAQAVIGARESDWNGEHARQWRASIAEVDPILGALPVDAIDTPLVLKAIESIWRRAQTTADRTRQRIEVILDWATARGARQGDNPARWKGHLEHVLKDNHKKTHHKALPYAELPAFMAALRAREGIASRALEFAILTSCRTREVLGARWAEIDGDIWTIPPERTKAGKRTGRPHVVPLPPPARKLLDALPRAGEFVFESPEHPGRRMERHAMADALKVMGVSATVHGYRSCFSDWAADNTAYPQEVREMCLGHSVPNKVEAAYRRGALLEKRKRLMSEWGRFATGGSARTGKVIAIRR
jgi:integrase